MSSHHAADDSHDGLEALCRKAGQGDGDALEALLCMHHRRLAGYLRRKIGLQWQGKIDPDDVLQEAYLEAFSGISGFDYQGDDSFYHWIVRLTDHRFFHQVRGLQTKKRDVGREVRPRADSRTGYQALLTQCLGDSQTPSRIMRRADAEGALMSCIARLPDDYRIVVRRLHLNEEPLASVAADMARTEDAVRRLASRAVEQLSKCLGRASKYLSDAG